MGYGDAADPANWRTLDIPQTQVVRRLAAGEAAKEWSALCFRAEKNTSRWVLVAADGCWW